jgi:hypothetical protein
MSFQNQDIEALPLEILTPLVFAANGKTVPGAARRVLHGLFYGEIEVDGKRGPDAVAALPIETKLNFYESIASDRDPRNVGYLAALNDELGLTKAFYDRHAKLAANYFEPMFQRQREWRAAGNKGSFASLVQRLAANDKSLTRTDKERAAKFIVESFGKHIGLEKAPTVVFFEDKPELQGFAKDGVVYVNTNSIGFNKDTSKFVDTLFHEVTHIKQGQLAVAYRAGKIPESHPDYVHARVFAANLLTESGYIPPENNIPHPAIAHAAYKAQPVEVDARHSGATALAAARKVADLSVWKHAAVEILHHAKPIAARVANAAKKVFDISSWGRAATEAVARNMGRFAEQAGPSLAERSRAPNPAFNHG